MSGFQDLYQQLKKRRVIRTAVVYAALVWGALQVADLLAEAGFLSEGLVRWLIIAALVGFPLTLLFSWFYEAPWRQRRGLSVLGDVAVILAVGVGILLFAWQQYFVSFARPTLAVLAIEATDARTDTGAIGPYLAGRIRMALAGQAELAVTELSSSLRPELSNRAIADRASALIADFVLTGTLNQRGDALNVNLQLYNGDGELLWSEGFEDRLLDLGEMESRILNALWTQLPLSPEGLVDASAVVTKCEYPPEADAIRTLALAEVGALTPDTAVEALSSLIDRHGDNGLLHLARAGVFFAQVDAAPPPRQPVLNNLAQRDLEQVIDRCPGFPGAALEKLHRSPAALEEIAGIESQLLAFPNDSRLLMALADAWREAGDLKRSAAIAREAWRTDPLAADTVCGVVQLLDETGSTGSAEEVLVHAKEFISEESLICVPREALR